MGPSEDQSTCLSMPASPRGTGSGSRHQRGRPRSGTKETEANRSKSRTGKRALRISKEVQNSLAPISHLPPEILSQVFFLARDSFESSYIVGSPSVYSWLKVTHVCRSWRQTALGSARLWSRIILGRADMTKLFLDRSKIALEELHRAQCLIFGLHPFTYRLFSMKLQALPLLRSVYLHHDLRSEWARFPFDPMPAIFDTVQLPALKKVVMSHYLLRFPSNLWARTLTSLAINELRRLPVSDVLNILRGTPDLTHLELAGAITEPHILDPSTRLDLPSATLPHLEKFTLHVALDIAPWIPLLDHIHHQLSTTCHFFLGLPARVPIPESNVHSFTETFISKVSGRTGIADIQEFAAPSPFQTCVLGFVFSTSSFSLWRDHLSICDLGDHLDEWSAERSCSSHITLDANFLPQITFLQRVFPKNVLGHVRTFVVRSLCDFAEWNAQTWRPVWESMPLLEELNFSLPENYDVVGDVLTPVLASSSGPLLPQLRTLALEYDRLSSLSQVFIEALKSFLEERRKDGRPLSHLMFRDRNTVPAGIPAGKEAEFEQLRPLVSQLTFFSHW